MQGSEKAKQVRVVQISAETLEAIWNCRRRMTYILSSCAGVLQDLCSDTMLIFLRRKGLSMKFIPFYIFIKP
jgi:hypothetical protein